MKSLDELLKAVGLETEISDTKKISGMTYDSRKIKSGDLFFAMSGTQTDGHQYLEDVKNKGAVAAIVETPNRLVDLPQIKVDSVLKWMAPLAHEFYDRPSHQLPVIGVTGTNGKTTVTYLLENLLRTMGETTGVMGTINYRIGDTHWPAPNTTPMASDVQWFLREAINKKASRAVMEVSSHALDLHRVDFVRFHLGIFTNLTQDHLDFHKTMENYFQAKSKLFNDPFTKAVINFDDPYGRKLVRKRKDALLFGINSPEGVIAKKPKTNLGGIEFTLRFPSGREFPITSNLLGLHNVSNLLAAAAALLALGYDEARISEALNAPQSIPGRLERVEGGQKFVVVVDYAHTHDALAQVLLALKETKPKRLLCLFGAGGDRDRGKRPKMGDVATAHADFVIVTSDNPRTEDPKIILDDIVEGIQSKKRKNYKVVVDRAAAIREIIGMAEEGDILLLAGKGHEDYQIVGTKKHHFSDKEEALKAING